MIQSVGRICAETPSDAPRIWNIAGKTVFSLDSTLPAAKRRVDLQQALDDRSASVTAIRSAPALFGADNRGDGDDNGEGDGDDNGEGDGDDNGEGDVVDEQSKSRLSPAIPDLEFLLIPEKESPLRPSSETASSDFSSSSTSFYDSSSAFCYSSFGFSKSGNILSLMEEEKSFLLHCVEDGIFDLEKTFLGVVGENDDYQTHRRRSRIQFGRSNRNMNQLLGKTVTLTLSQAGLAAKRSLKEMDK